MVGSELLFEVFSQRYESGATLVTSNLPFDEWTSVFGSERLAGALLDRLTHHVHILEMNGESFRLATSKKAQRRTVMRRTRSRNRLPKETPTPNPKSAAHQKIRASRPFSLNPTGILSRRHLAHFVSAVDTADSKTR